MDFEAPRKTPGKGWYMMALPSTRLVELMFLLLIVWSPSFLYAQSPVVQSEAIKEFSEILKDQPNAVTLELNDLSDTQLVIHWVYRDRRASRVFLNRIMDYLGPERVKIIYHWSWPDQVFKPDDQTPIIVYDAQSAEPDWLASVNAYKIKIGPVAQSPGNMLHLPDANEDLLDLAAQFILDGIKLDSHGNITTASRVSYLSAEYLGLDEEYLIQQLDSIMNHGLDAGAYPGARVSIAYKGSVIYDQSVGYHTYDSNYLVRTHDLYDLASVTKITAGVASLMLLQEAGKFDTRKTLEDYFPYFKNTDKGELEIQRILTHSAGLTPYLVYYNMAQKENGKYHRNTLAFRPHGHYNYAVTDSIYVSDRFSDFIYQAIKETSLKSGNKYEYSGLFFLLIPDLVKELTGVTLDHFLIENLFNPLGAHRTAFNPFQKYSIHQIVPTEVDMVWRNQLVHGGVHDEAAAVLGGVSTNAGLFSSGPDLIKIGETWRRGGRFGNKQYWSPETVRLFTQCYYCEEGNRRALGFDRPPLPDQNYTSYMSPLASQESYGHSGFTGTMFWVDPAAEYTFAFLSNRVHPTRENTKLYSLNIRSNLHSVLYKTIERSR